MKSKRPSRSSFMLRRFLEQLSLAAERDLSRRKRTRLLQNHVSRKQAALRTLFSKFRSRRTMSIFSFGCCTRHLENFKSEYPITLLFRWKPSRLNRRRQQFGLFETSLRDPNQLYETLARLVALLGSDRVGTPVLEETHRPDAFHIEPFSWEPGGTTSRVVPLFVGRDRARHSNCVATISTGRICIRFSVRRYSAHLRSAQRQRQSRRATWPLSGFRKLVG